MTDSLPSPKKTITQTFRFPLGGGSGERTQGLHSPTSTDPGAELPISYIVPAFHVSHPPGPGQAEAPELPSFSSPVNHISAQSQPQSLLLCQSSGSALAEALQPIRTLGWCRAGGCADQGRTCGILSCPALTRGCKQAMPLSLHQLGQPSYVFL